MSICSTDKPDTNIGPLAPGTPATGPEVPGTTGIGPEVPGMIGIGPEVPGTTGIGPEVPGTTGIGLDAPGMPVPVPVPAIGSRQEQMVPDNQNNQVTTGHGPAKPANNARHNRKLQHAEIQKQITTRGLSGLTNLGNTCYMNAALQALSVTKPLLAYITHPTSNLIHDLKNRIVEDIYNEHIKKNNEGQELKLIPAVIGCTAKKTLTYKLRILFKYMWAYNCEITARQFKRGVDKQLTFFCGMRQHDAQEFLTALLDKIHEDTKSKGITKNKFGKKICAVEKELESLELALDDSKKQKNDEAIRLCIEKIDNLYQKKQAAYLQVRAMWAWKKIIETSYSVINDIFSGLSMTTITCDVCKKSNHRFERFDIMTLHLPEEISTEKNSYSLNELMSNYMSNEEMKNVNKYYCAYCKIKNDAVKKLILYQQPNVLVIMIKKYQKYNNSIIKSNIRIEYDHKLDITPYISEHVKGENKYELYAAIRHAGNYAGGHYYSYVKNPINGLWYICDDGDVYHVDADEVLRCNGYVLFYRQFV
jgi:ubiquitin carboxyl-terminal hydrolase 8